MTKIHRSSGLALALVCFALLSTGAPALAQDNAKKESTTEPDNTFGNGGKKTTTYSDHDGKHFIETTYWNPKGNLAKKTSEISDDNGVVKEGEVYSIDGKKLLLRWREEYDKKNNLLRKQTEEYKDGVMVSGFRYDYTGLTFKTIADFYRPVPATHRYSLLHQKWEEIKPEEKLPTEDKLKELKAKTIGRLISNGAVKIEVTGTGETIGHIADVSMQNASNQALKFYFPPAILESKSGKYQDYIAPLGQEVALRSGQTKTIPVNGTCLERDKPPEGKGVTGDLILNDGNSEFVNFDSHFPPQTANAFLRIAEAKYEAVDKLQKEGAFKDFPYHEKQEQKNIVIQWSVWSDPRICEITGTTPATKEDFQTVVYKQVQERDLASPKAKEKIDKGDDAMWSGIELAGAKAKELEKPDPSEQAQPPTPSSQTPPPSPSVATSPTKP